MARASRTKKRHTARGQTVRRHQEVTDAAGYAASHVRIRGAIIFTALIGAGITAYITFTGFSGGEAICVSGESNGQGCGSVLSSAWATFLGVPLSLFGLIAYLLVLGVAAIPLALRRKEWEFRTSLTLVGVTFAMTAFSLYLMTGLFRLPGIQGVCYYCLGSAAAAAILAGLSFFSYSWRSIGHPVTAGGGLAVLTLLIALGVFTVPNVINGRIVVSAAQGHAIEPYGWTVKTTSGESEEALAIHLNSVGAKMYGAWWCPHCYTQKQLFGDTASKLIPYVECADRGVNPQPEECSSVGVRSYPSWVVDGRVFPGVADMEILAGLSGYTGPQDFQYTFIR